MAQGESCFRVYAGQRSSWRSWFALAHDQYQRRTRCDRRCQLVRRALPPLILCDILRRYTSFLYLAACAACTRLARAVGDDEFGGKCSTGLERGKEGLQRLLWDEQGGAWLQAWCEAEDENRGHALQGEAMYV
jgi:hypothetical protein